MQTLPSPRSDPDVSRRTRLSIALGSLAAIFIAAAALGDRPARAGSSPSGAVPTFAATPSAGTSIASERATDRSVPPAAEALAHRTFEESEPAPTF